MDMLHVCLVQYTTCGAVMIVLTPHMILVYSHEVWLPVAYEVGHHGASGERGVQLSVDVEIEAYGDQAAVFARAKPSRKPCHCKHTRVLQLARLDF